MTIESIKGVINALISQNLENYKKSFNKCFKSILRTKVVLSSTGIIRRQLRSNQQRY